MPGSISSLSLSLVLKLCVLCSFSTTLVAAIPFGPEVLLESGGGTIVGVHALSGVDEYRGIPFAEPPIGPLRFKSPVPAVLPSSKGKYHATRIKKSCPQIDFSKGLGEHGFLGDEDCLYLDIYVLRRLHDSQEPLPVMIWLFGGAFVMGDGYEYGAYNPSELVKNGNVIVVEPNYRVGAFGFLVAPALQRESATQTAGNMGMMDQVAS